MNNIIELSSGHVFAQGSVRSLSPLYEETLFGSGDEVQHFIVYGVGFQVQIRSLAPNGAALYKEAKEKLFS